MAAKWWRTAGGGLRALSANSSTPAPSSSSSRGAASYHTIQAIPRELTGSRISARDRTQGRIPAVVFSQSLLEKNPSHRSSAKKHLLTTERKQIQSIVKSVELPFFCSTRFPLQIRAGSGSSVLLDSGGKLNRIRTSLKYICPAEHIPRKIEVDVSNLDIGDKILMRDVEVHPSLKLLSKNEEMPICKVVASQLENPECAGV
ncbi:hypothetical protein TIFTF001_002634 [Ficus carica]|uniref:Large ribosomal subunit protein bL25 beta domain-containing protein n=1 Tax=Ficus carica TaxID=3494 RepID=A0AA87Z5L2_FICCA|nr:hypothetical protein TIFTF001_002634 [Ficus carica]